MMLWNSLKKIYRITQEPSFSKDFGLRDQIRLAVVSISSNIAEGDERGTNRESIHFFNCQRLRQQKLSHNLISPTGSVMLKPTRTTTRKSCKKNLESLKSCSGRGSGNNKYMARKVYFYHL
ncbi:MAG: four helix bundle protein [Lewinellaceae bacterium]|nr:four helix bundle protein [Lewinellaceae bacterium]